MTDSVLQRHDEANNIDALGSYLPGAEDSDRTKALLLERIADPDACPKVLLDLLCDLVTDRFMNVDTSVLRFRRRVTEGHSLATLIGWRKREHKIALSKRVTENQKDVVAALYGRLTECDSPELAGKLFVLIDLAEWRQVVSSSGECISDKQGLLDAINAPGVTGEDLKILLYQLLAKHTGLAQQAEEKPLVTRFREVASGSDSGKQGRISGEMQEVVTAIAMRQLDRLVSEIDDAGDKILAEIRGTDAFEDLIWLTGELRGACGRGWTNAEMDFTHKGNFLCVSAEQYCRRVESEWIYEEHEVSINAQERASFQQRIDQKKDVVEAELFGKLASDLKARHPQLYDHEDALVTARAIAKLLQAIDYKGAHMSLYRKAQGGTGVTSSEQSGALFAPSEELFEVANRLPKELLYLEALKGEDNWRLLQRIGVELFAVARLREREAGL